MDGIVSRNLWLPAFTGTLLIQKPSPYPYPGHTYIPMTLEKACTQAKVVPHSQRKDEVVVLGKLFGKPLCSLQKP